MTLAVATGHAPEVSGTDRRAFLALLGGAAALGLTGCATAAGAPARPERVACVSGGPELHAALLIGVDPVLAARGPGDAVVATMGYDLVGVARPVGEELPGALAQARPDLVLHTEQAPPAGLLPAVRTVRVDPAAGIDEQLAALGTVLGREAEAEQAMGGYLHLRDRTRAVVGSSVLAGTTVAVLAPGPAGAVLLGPATPAGAALLGVGVGRVPEHPGEAADFWLRVTGVPAAEMPPGRSAWVGEEFVLESALTRLARLREIDRLARWFGMQR